MNKCPVISLDAWKRKKQPAVRDDFSATMMAEGSTRKDGANIHDLRITTVPQRGDRRWPVIKPEPAGMAPANDDPAV